MPARHKSDIYIYIDIGPMLSVVILRKSGSCGNVQNNQLIIRWEENSDGRNDDHHFILSQSIQNLPIS